MRKLPVPTVKFSEAARRFPHGPVTIQSPGCHRGARAPEFQRCSSAVRLQRTQVLGRFLPLLHRCLPYLYNGSRGKGPFDPLQAVDPVSLVTPCHLPLPVSFFLYYIYSLISWVRVCIWVRTWSSEDNLALVSFVLPPCGFGDQT